MNIIQILIIAKQLSLRFADMPSARTRNQITRDAGLGGPRQRGSFAFSLPDVVESIACAPAVSIVSSRPPSLARRPDVRRARE